MFMLEGEPGESGACAVSLEGLGMGTRMASRAACRLLCQVSTLASSSLVWSSSWLDLASMVALRQILRCRVTCLSTSMALWKVSRLGGTPILPIASQWAVRGRLIWATCCAEPVLPRCVFRASLWPGMAQVGMLCPRGLSPALSPS